MRVKLVVMSEAESLMCSDQEIKAVFPGTEARCLLPCEEETEIDSKRGCQWVQEGEREAGSAECAECAECSGRHRAHLC